MDIDTKKLVLCSTEILSLLKVFVSSPTTKVEGPNVTIYATGPVIRIDIMATKEDLRD